MRIPIAMTDFSIQPIIPADRDWIQSLLRERWGSDFVVAHGTIFYPADLPGLTALQGDQKAGLLTYNVTGEECEIVTLNSLAPSQGIGSALIDAVKTIAKRSGCRRLRVTTTNDNLNALRFYQKQGFVLAALRPNALEISRKLKPIPALGENGIPIRDEIELEMILDE
jgi:ribosomal protein S18 acetylase RimI-like enzyme